MNFEEAKINNLQDNEMDLKDEINKYIEGHNEKVIILIYFFKNSKQILIKLRMMLILNNQILMKKHFMIRMIYLSKIKCILYSLNYVENRII